MTATKRGTTEEKSTEKREIATWVITTVLVITIIAYMVMVPMGMVRSDNRLGIPEIMLIAIAILWLSGLLKTITELMIGTDGISAKFGTMESQIHDLQMVVKGLVTEYEFDKLQGLTRDERFMVIPCDTMRDELQQLICQMPQT